MTTEPRPARAEVTDAANAVNDGVDAIRLAGETAIGAFPARAVETLDAIIREAEGGPSAAGALIGQQLVARGLVSEGAAVVLVSISPDLTRSGANYLKIQRL